jgi:hypothetical protein
MVYSIAILDQSDFEGIGRQMPSGTGVDASLADRSTVARKRKKRGTYKKHNNNNNNNNYSTNNNIASVIETIGSSKSRLKALQILIEFGSAEEKIQALAEVRSLAYQKPDPISAPSDAASITVEDAVAAANDAAADESCTGSEDEDSDGIL